MVLDDLLNKNKPSTQNNPPPAPRPETLPQEGTLKYMLQKTISVSTKQDEVTLLITNGTTVRRVSQTARKQANLDNLNHRILVQLWQQGTEVSSKIWRTKAQRNDESTITDSVDTILAQLQASATPDADDLLSAARDSLKQSGKIDEWRKINAMLQDMNETQLRGMIAFILLITLTKSVGD